VYKGVTVDQVAFFERDADSLDLELFRVEVDDVQILQLDRIADGRRVVNVYD
jgi:hypothetical protein